MRAALGASRGRIRRALLAESVVLALAGGVVGVALAWASIGLLRTMAPAELPRVDEIGIDLTVLVFTLVVSVLSGAVFGLFAALRFGSPAIAALKEGGRSTSDAPARHRTRHALVVGQVALALTLLIVSGLLIRTFVALRQVDPGFTRPEEVQTFVIAIPPGLISDAALAARTFESVAERLSQVPGVASVGLSSSITMDGEDNGNPLEAEGVPIPEDGRRRSGGSRASRRDTSRPWGSGWSQGDRLRGARSTSGGPSSSFPSRSRVRCGENPRKRSATASGCAAPGTSNGAKSSESTPVPSPCRRDRRRPRPPCRRRCCRWSPC